MSLSLSCLVRIMIFFILMPFMPLIALVLSGPVTFMLVFSVAPASVLFAAAVAILVPQAGTPVTFCRTIGPLRIRILQAVLAHVLRSLPTRSAVDVFGTILASQC